MGCKVGTLNAVYQILKVGHYNGCVQFECIYQYIIYIYNINTYNLIIIVYGERF